ncbi:MAG: sigma-54-dependent transcriptional regulator [Thermodesulfobacteriota bacterium]
MSIRIMIIDDEEAMRHMLGVMLRREGYDTVLFENAGDALAAAAEDDFGFILCDIRMPGIDGLEFLRRLREVGKDQTVIMMSAYGTLDLAVECMKLGAYDYVSKPFKTDEIILTVRKAEERERLKRENARLREEAARDYDTGGIYTIDEKMLSMLDLVRKVADYSSSVLITGESGTGKELVARALHFGGSRAGGPFVVVNCGAIPAALLESELFGHVKGAFTGAVRNKTGLFEEADGGTIFLDEVGELPMELQVKLLRVLQEGEIRRVGDTRPVKVDARVVAATVRDLKGCISSGTFREDLYYRLNVIEVELPPLRLRPSDIDGLARFFIEKYAGKFGKPVKGLTPGAAEALKAYHWPGNVRELENIIERAMILEETGMIRRETLPLGPGASASPAAPSPAGGPDPDLSIKKAHVDMEREFIKMALEKTGGNRTRAAELLEISHRALLYKIKSYGL